MSWIDSHCHLDHASFEHDLTAVLQRAMDDGVSKFVVAGTAFHQWDNQQALEQKYPNIYNAYGIHPWFCDLHTEEHLEQLDDRLDDAIAVGECGLDLMPNKPDIEKQTFWFEAQLALAKKHDLPAIVHSVKAHDLVVRSLKKVKSSRGVVHGFSGNMQQAQALIDCGYFIGIGTRLIKTHSDKAIALLRELPLRHMLLETDAPDGMGKDVRNEPKELILVANIVAKIREQAPETVLDTCSQNAKELFDI